MSLFIVVIILGFACTIYTAPLLDLDYQL